MGFSEAIADPVFWLVSAPMVWLFVASIVRIARPYRKPDQ